MLRIVLASVGVVTAAVTGWLVKRQFFSGTADEAPPVVIQMPQLYRPNPRRKKGRRVELSPTLDNGEGGIDPAA